MKINVLLVNYAATALDTYIPLLDGQGITAQAAPTMLEALNMLLSGEYSGVVINADDFDYLLYLKVMRALTTIPIGVAVSCYNKEEQDIAFENGANLFRVRHNDAEHRVTGFANAVKIYLELYKTHVSQPVPITHNGVRIFPANFTVFVQDIEIKMQKLEIGILCCLIMNKGRILSHDQIYSKVWGEEYSDDPKQALWTRMSALRKKLREEANLPDFIKTERGIGYRVDK